MLDEDQSQTIDLPEFYQLTSLIGHEYASDDDVGETPSISANTTLTVHLFGQQGKQLLNYENFKKVVDNLWEEMVQVEFDYLVEPNTRQLSVFNFGRIVLRYTHLDDIEQAAYLNKLKKSLDNVSHRHISFAVVPRLIIRKHHCYQVLF